MSEQSFIVLKRVKDLHPIEGYIEELLQKVYISTVIDGYWTNAIKIEKHNLILDGHHRFELAKRYNLNYIPVVIFDYNDVDMWSLRKEIKITKNDVIRNSLNGNLYPNKTVKHKFPDVNCKCKIKLMDLR